MRVNEVKKLTQQFRFHPAVSDNWFKNPHQWLGQLVLQVVGGVYGDVMLQNEDRIL